MSPIVSGGGAGGGTSALSLFDSTLSGAASSIDSGAGSIPAGHGVIRVLFYLRTTEAVVTSNPQITFNSDSGANYDRVYVTTTNASVTGNNSLAQTSFLIDAAGASRATSFFAETELVIPNYDGTVGFKAFHTVNGATDSTAANNIIIAQGGTWRSTTAITRITLTAASGNFVAGSRMTVIAGF